jgi:hypothetical protein
MVRRLSLIVVLVIVVTAVATPAWAQSHLNGDWVGLFHEDEPERAPGPDRATTPACRSTRPAGCMPTAGTQGA